MSRFPAAMADPRRIVTLAILVVLVFTILFPFTGQIVDTTEQNNPTFSLGDVTDHPSYYTIHVLALSFHASVQTFSLSTSQGLLVTGPARYLADIEAFLGILFIAALAGSFFHKITQTEQ